MQERVILEGEDVTTTIRNEEVGAAASKVAALPRVREALITSPACVSHRKRLNCRWP